MTHSPYKLQAFWKVPFPHTPVPSLKVLKASTRILPIDITVFGRWKHAFTGKKEQTEKEKARRKNGKIAQPTNNLHTSSFFPSL